VKLHLVPRSGANLAGPTRLLCQAGGRDVKRKRVVNSQRLFYVALPSRVFMDREEFVTLVPRRHRIFIADRLVLRSQPFMGHGHMGQRASTKRFPRAIIVLGDTFLSRSITRVARTQGRRHAARGKKTRVGRVVEGKKVRQGPKRENERQAGIDRYHLLTRTWVRRGAPLHARAKRRDSPRWRIRAIHRRPLRRIEPRG